MLFEKNYKKNPNYKRYGKVQNTKVYDTKKTVQKNTATNHKTPQQINTIKPTSAVTGVCVCGRRGLPTAVCLEQDRRGSWCPSSVPQVSRTPHIHQVVLNDPISKDQRSRN